MFLSNSIGELRRAQGRDIHARVTYAAPVSCPFAPVNLARKVEPTDRRADTSASRGAAEEIVSAAKILVPAYVSIGIDDLFSFSGNTYRVSGVHDRYTVAGEFDHFECNLEVMPK